MGYTVNHERQTSHSIIGTVLVARRGWTWVLDMARPCRKGIRSYPRGRGRQPSGWRPSSFMGNGIRASSRWFACASSMRHAALRPSDPPIRWDPGRQQRGHGSQGKVRKGGAKRRQPTNRSRNSRDPDSLSAGKRDAGHPWEGIRRQSVCDFRSPPETLVCYLTTLVLAVSR